MRCALLSIVAAATLLVACQAADAPEIASRTAALQPDYPGATYDQALAYSVGRQYGFQPTFIVIHVAQGYYQGTISWFKDPQSGVSSHYVVSKNGDVTQMVEEKDEAYHVGSNVNVLSIGIEHEGFVDDPATWFTDQMYQGSAALVKNITERWGIPRDRCHIIGHDEVPDPTNTCTYGGAEHHTDPGSGWDWNKYMGYIGGSATKCSYDCTSTEGSLVGYVRKGSLLPTAQPVVGAQVSIGTSGSTTTDSTGFYRFDNLSIGYYFPIKVTAPGYKTATQNQAVVIPLDHYSNFAMATAPLPDGGPPPPPPLDQGPPPGDGSPPPPPGDTPVIVGDGGPPPAGDGPASSSDGTYVPPAGEGGGGGGGGGGGCSLASAGAGASAGPGGLVLLLLLGLVLRRGRRQNPV